MLSENCLLVSLRITMPPQTRTSKSASQKVESDYRTARKQGKVTKNLFSEKDIKPLTQIMSQARTEFNKISLPYDDAYRIIPSNTYFDFCATMSALSQSFDTQKQEFLRNYPEILNRAMIALGDLFSYDDYPSTTKLSNIVSFSIDSSIVPPVTAFDDLVGVTPDDVEKLKEQALAGQQDKVEQALKDLFERLHDSLHKARVKLSVEDSVFRDTLIGNIHSALAAVDTLNFSDNQELIDLAHDVRVLVADIKPQDLREDKELRKETAENTQAVLDKMADFF